MRNATEQQPPPQDGRFNQFETVRAFILGGFDFLHQHHQAYLFEANAPCDPWDGRGLERD
jgi:hypothetical protein